jgi:hypothetical protein
MSSAQLQAPELPVAGLLALAPPGEAGSCSVCPHPLAAHDQISLRFCRATTSGAATRGCVCPSH